MDGGATDQMTVQFVTNDKVAETSSKGNQEKWQDGGRWYKLDQFGYEGLAAQARTFSDPESLSLPCPTCSKEKVSS